MAKKEKPVTTLELIAMKQRGERIAVLTAYDYLMAGLLDESGIDCVLVGDSVGQVVAGEDSTLPVTLEQMIYHGKAVARGLKRALLVVDMPFLTYQVSAEEAVRNCGRVLQQTGAQAVKLEGGHEEMARTVRKLVDSGIPVMGHLGLTIVWSVVRTRSTSFCSPTPSGWSMPAVSASCWRCYRGASRRRSPRASPSQPSGSGRARIAMGKFWFCRTCSDSMRDSVPAFSSATAN
jgi:hypothetical protein